LSEARKLGFNLAFAPPDRPGDADAVRDIGAALARALG